jgi:hypothetical protein
MSFCNWYLENLIKGVKEQTKKPTSKIPEVGFLIFISWMFSILLKAKKLLFYFNSFLLKILSNNLQLMDSFPFLNHTCTKAYFNRK